MLARADQALQILERYKARLDAVSGSLSALEVEDLVTRARRRHRAAARRDGAPHRRGDRGLRRRARRRRPPRRSSSSRSSSAASRTTAASWPRTTSSSRADWELDDVIDAARRARRPTTLLDLREVAARAAPPARTSTSTRRCSRAATGCSHKIPRLPEIVADHVVERFAQPAEDHARQRCPTSSRSKASARRGPGRSRTASPASPRPRILDRYVVSRPHASPAGAVAANGARPHDVRRRASVTLTASTATPTSTAIHARPDGHARRAGVVLHPDIVGLRPLFDDMCRRLATHGFAVCAPEPFAASRRRRGVAPTIEERHGRRRRARRRRCSSATSSARPTASSSTTTCRASSVLGFCMGGLRVQGRGHRPVRRAVAFYGMIRVPEAGAGPEHARAARLGRRRVPDARDLRRPRTTARPRPTSTRCAAAWSGRPDCEIVVYEGADHGFVHDPDRPAHRADDAADAWRRALAFLPDECAGPAQTSRAVASSSRRGRGCGTGCGRRPRASRAARTWRSPC